MIVLLQVVDFRSVNLFETGQSGVSIKSLCFLVGEKRNLGSRFSPHFPSEPHKT